MILPMKKNVLTATKSAALALTIALGAVACQPAQPEAGNEEMTAAASQWEDQKLPEWAKSANIYEVNIRQYTPEGTLSAFEAHLPRLADLGVDILWFMPIQPIGERNRKGELGSYYSIQDYTAVNPDFGTVEDFKSIVDKAHELGMHVILDWVANHSAWDHPWVESNDDFYTRDEDGSYPMEAIGNDGGKTGWTDVADLNYDVPLLTDSMAAEMDWWVAETGIDGFRCDMAGMIPYAFWEHAIPMLREKHGPLFFLAEWSEPHLLSTFNADYGWEMHHMMNDIAKGHKSTQDLVEYASKNDTVYPDDALKLYFTSNHDENSWQGSAVERMGEHARAYFALSTLFEQSIPLLYSGQEAGLDYRFPFFSKDTVGVDWNANPEHAGFYHVMFALKDAHPALWNGKYGGDMVLEADAEANTLELVRFLEGDTVIGRFAFGEGLLDVAPPAGFELNVEVPGAAIFTKP